MLKTKHFRFILLNEMMKKKRSRYILLLIIVLLAVDQITKIYIKTHFTLGEGIMVLGDWFQIRFIENPGAAFGFEFGGDFGKLFLSLLRIVLIGFGAYYLVRMLKKSVKPGILIAVALVLCGAVGNLIDSIFYGEIFSESTPFQVATLFPEGGGYASWLHGNVVDMLYFPIIDTVLPQWVPFWGGEPFVFFSPIFNLADTYISVAFIYLILFERKALMGK